MSTKSFLRRCSFLFSVAALSLLFISHPALAKDDQAVVLTGYPDNISRKYQEAFEKKYPGKKITVKKVSSGKVLSEVQGDADADIYWAAALRAFDELNKNKLFAKLNLDPAVHPYQIAGSPIADADGHYAAFELAGYAIAYNQNAIQKLGVAAPKEWSDLANPVYAGKITLPMPKSAGGPAPMAVETILQAYGWEKGWALLSEMVGNAYVKKDDDKKNPLTSGDVAAQINLDFFIASGIEKDSPVRLIYPQQTAYNPGLIGILNKAKNKETAQQFVDFALSEEGQKMLYDDFSRLPARRDLFDSDKISVANPYTNTTLKYDWQTAQVRAPLVVALFDTVLTQKQAEYAPLWQALYAAQGKVPTDKINEVRKLLTAMPVNETQQADQSLRTLFAAPKEDAKAQEEQGKIKKQWEEDATKRIEQVKTLLK